MPIWLKQFYKNYVIKKNWLVSFIVGMAILAIGCFVTDFRMDASGDSLLLENDKSLQYYREVKQRYASDDYLFVTFQPKEELFTKKTIRFIIP